MIAAALIAASALAPSGVTATTQAGPVCLPVTAQPGAAYDLHVAATAGTLSVAPAHGRLEHRLHQVPPSWVSFGASVPVLLGPDREPGLSVTVRLAVPPSAAPGAYWSDITVTTGSSGSGDVKTGTQATAPFVFTVGPSATPPPPCGDLDVAYSTGEFPAWPTPAFKTTSWQQVFARQRPARPAPEDTCPTATAGPAASAAPSYCPSTGHDPATVPAVAYSSAANAAPAANAPAGKVPKIPSDWPGWLILIGIILLALAGLRRRMRS